MRGLFLAFLNRISAARTDVSNIRFYHTRTSSREDMDFKFFDKLWNGRSLLKDQYVGVLVDELLRYVRIYLLNT